MAKKKTAPKENMFDANALGKKKAPIQTVESDYAKVKQEPPKRDLPKETAKPKKEKPKAKAKMGRPKKTKEQIEATKIVNLRIHKDQLKFIDDHLKATFQKNRHQYILDAVYQRIRKEQMEFNR